jgi:hypothetical protein
MSVRLLTSISRMNQATSGGQAAHACSLQCGTLTHVRCAGGSIQRRGRTADLVTLEPRQHVLSAGRAVDWRK